MWVRCSLSVNFSEENNIAYINNCTLLARPMEQITSQGFDALPKLIRNRHHATLQGSMFSIDDAK